MADAWLERVFIIRRRSSSEVDSHFSVLNLKAASSFVQHHLIPYVAAAHRIASCCNNHIHATKFFRPVPLFTLCSRLTLLRRSARKEVLLIGRFLCPTTLLLCLPLHVEERLTSPSFVNRKCLTASVPLLAGHLTLLPQAHRLTRGPPLPSKPASSTRLAFYCPLITQQSTSNSVTTYPIHSCLGKQFLVQVIHTSDATPPRWKSTFVLPELSGGTWPLRITS